jgi:glycosyltransferase involved in cell wall biosynthesis
MNILHINDKLEISGGVEVYIDQLCKYGEQCGIANEWISIQKSAGSGYLFESKKQTKKQFSALKSLVKHLTVHCNDNNIDIIHVHSISNPSLIRALFKIRPVVRSMHEPRIACPGQGKFWRNSEKICDQPFGLHCFYHAYKEGCCNRHPKRLLKAYNNVKFETTEGKQNYKAIIVMSEYMENEAIKVGYKKDQLFLNPHFTEPVSDVDLVDQSNSEKKSIIFIGRLSRTKGVHYFIECGVRLLEKGYKVQLDIVGDGHDADYFKEKIPEKYINDFIFHGWQSRENINRLLNQSYLMIFPSIYPEAFGISGIEAMMRGKPVVGFDVGGVSTWLKDGLTGFAVEVKNVEEMSKKIYELIEDKELYNKISVSNRSFAIKNFNISKHVNTLVNTYDKALKNQP